MNKQQLVLLAALVLLLGLFLSLSACNAQPTTSPGEALIQKGKCFACHAYPGNQAVTDEKLAPSFCRTQRRYWNGEIDRAYLRESIVNPKAQAGPMPMDEAPGPHTPTPWNPHLRIMPEGYADIFTDEEIDQIIDFILNLDCSTFTPGAPN
ncbi:MAG: c-type cytochrome [Chloroflexi bacterium]|nr:c-type cytochrome [Chloroflexota bacterium]